MYVVVNTPALAHLLLFGSFGWGGWYVCEYVNGGRIVWLSQLHPYVEQPGGGPEDGEACFTGSRVTGKAGHVVHTPTLFHISQLQGVCATLWYIFCV